MKATEFYRIIASEESTVQFLRQHELLPSVNNLPDCIKCGGGTREVTRKNRNGKEYKSLRCSRKGCQTYQSIRKPNVFFTFEDVNSRCNSNLTLSEILELVYYWSYDTAQVSTQTFTGRADHTICDWYNLCRDVCVEMFDRRQPFGGPGNVVQIDESLLRGKRKYNRGRMLLGNKQGEELSSDDSDAQNIVNQRNHGKRIEGPWVFGLSCRTTDKLETRFFIVERRDAATLLPIIQREVIPGSIIMSDEWPSYKGLGQMGYDHRTVNHQENFINPSDGTNTQTIETCWGILKLKILRKMRSTTSEMLPRYLAESWWRSINKNDDYFLAMLRDIRNVYG